MRFMWLVLVGGCVFIGKDAHEDRLASICATHPDDPACGGDADTDADADSDTDADADTDSDTDTDPNLVDCYTDDDGDGFGTGPAIPTEGSCGSGLSDNPDDCDDGDGAIHPNAVETCGNTVDENCDGIVGETLAAYTDTDGDGYGVGASITVCGLAPGLADQAGDCNDAVDAVNPGATEVVADGIDQDCDGFEACPIDLDGDGFLSSAVTVNGALDCPPISGPEDCADADDSVFPGALEVVGDGVDQNCDGVESCYTDADDDGYGDDGAALLTTTTGVDCDLESGRASVAGDCDDEAADVNPGAEEVCTDAIDHDCTGDPGGASWYFDSDGDQYGDPATLDASCESPGAGWVTLGGDCADTDQAIHPGAAEVPADGVDQDCDGFELCYADLDEDGFGSGTIDGSLLCDGAFEASVDGDCDDQCSACTPTGTEICDGLDNDCDALVDDNATGQSTFYTDADGDTWGTAASVTACFQPSGTATRTGDCDDVDPDRNPGEPEICGDGIDNNCDPSDDQGGSTYWDDGDGDGYGAPGTGITTCTPGAAQVTNGDDCDDTKPEMFPGNTVLVVGDGLDNDCDGFEECYTDLDNDGYGANGAAIVDGPDATTCGGLATELGDCAPANPLINPGATETADNVTDENCDGLRLCYVDADLDASGSDALPPALVAACANGHAEHAGDCDDGNANINPSANDIVGNIVDEDCDNLWTCYRDSDGDLYAGGGNVELAQPCPSVSPGDCNDNQPTVHPGATELCDGLDNDCVGGVSSGETDPDTDGYVACASWVGTFAGIVGGGDCNQGNAAVNPGASEQVGNDLDENCDGEWLCYADGDGDTYGTNVTGLSSTACTPAADWSTRNDDCNDGASAVHPGATEVCNGIDDDCSGSIDPLEVDNDGDGVVECAPWMGGGTMGGGDCNDQNGQIYPGTEEHCDGIDESCGVESEAGLVSLEGQNYADLQDAVDNVNSGEIIHVCGGGDPFPVASEPSIRFQIRGHAVQSQRPVIISGDPNMAMFRASADLDIRNVDFWGENIGKPDSGACLAVDNADLYLDDVWFLECYTFADGGAIALSSGQITMTGGGFDNNGADGFGGAFGCQVCTGSFTNTDFIGNIADSGGAIAGSGTGPGIDVIGGVFDSNVALEDGGAVRGQLGFSYHSRGTDYFNNEANSGGAIALSGGTHLIENGTLDSNVAYGGGAAGIGLSAIANPPAMTLSGVTVTGHYDYPALRVQDGGTMTVTDGCLLYDNELAARVQGGSSLLESRASNWNSNPDNATDVQAGATTFNQAFPMRDFDCVALSGCTTL
ncbi:MAG: putative metal-binding motif-containing protein [Alphaproteobacteria bacterium]|nr:putative metal-binding motif-containing protein [Alphaproteobacteria bacterium]